MSAATTTGRPGSTSCRSDISSASFAGSHVQESLQTEGSLGTVTSIARRRCVRLRDQTFRILIFEGRAGRFLQDDERHRDGEPGTHRWPTESLRGYRGSCDSADGHLPIPGSTDARALRLHRPLRPSRARGAASYTCTSPRSGTAGPADIINSPTA